MSILCHQVHSRSLVIRTAGVLQQTGRVSVHPNSGMATLLKITHLVLTHKMFEDAAGWHLVLQELHGAAVLVVR